MKNSKGVSLITLVITIIVMIILAAIVINGSSDTTGRAQYAKFTSEFGGYADNVKEGVEDSQINFTLQGVTVNVPQKCYMYANGLKTYKKNSGDDVYNRSLPVGYIMPGVIRKIFDLDNPTDAVAYVIDDKNVNGYNKTGNNPDGSAGFRFYSGADGNEYHFITSNGNVFTLPGYPQTISDNTVKYFISNQTGQYYIVSGRSGIEPGKENAEGEIIDCEAPIYASDMEGIFGLEADGKTPVYTYNNPGTAEGRRTTIPNINRLPR